MRIFILSWLANAVALYLVARFIPGISIDNMVPADGLITSFGLKAILIGGLVMGILNAILRPLLAILTLPLSCLTLGLFYFVITGFVFFIGAKLTPGMHLSSFWMAILGSVLFGILNSIIGGLLGVRDNADAI